MDYEIDSFEYLMRKGQQMEMIIAISTKSDFLQMISD